MSRAVALGLAFFAAAAVCGCAGPGAAQKRAVASLEAERAFQAAVDKIRASKDEYGPANLVLYDLDLAQALADAGQRQQADARFAEAQDRMRDLWTLSVSKRAGAALANENVDDYRGEDFEHALSFVLRGLNLLAMGKKHDALIEAQRAEDFLDQLQKEAPRKRTYRDDAFARWLAAMLYQDLGMPDDARISREAEDRAYAGYAKAYGTPPPPAAVGQGEAEVVFLELEGPAPRKVRRAGGGPVGFLLNTSYPAYEAVTPLIARSVVSVGSTTADAVVAEDVGAIAAKDLQERLTLLEARSTLRAAAKLAATATGVDAVGSEFADIRGWSTMPARIRVARLRVPAGAASVRARYLDAAGREVATRAFEVDARPGQRVWLIDRAVR